jgi:TRAP-type C4-dicarboxylate transport system substrate-binding protein
LVFSTRPNLNGERIMRIRHIFIIAAAAAFVANATAAGAEEYTYGLYLPPKHNVATYGLKPLFEELGSKVPWKLVSGGQLFSAKGTLRSIGNRTAEAGLIVPSYQQGPLKHAFITADLMMMGADRLAMNAAAVVTYFSDCPECLGDYKRAGTIYLAGYSTGGYSLLCNKRVTSLADVKGKKLRTTGALGRWAKALGGTPVSMTSGEMVEAMQRGNIDCIVGPLAWLKAYPLQDSVKYIYYYNMGSYNGLGLVVMNRKAWDDYSADQKRSLWRALPATTARTVIAGYIGDDLRSRALANKKGIVITKAGNDIAAIWAKHKAKEVGVVINRAKKRGAKKPEKIVNAFINNVKKWEKIIAGTNLNGMIAAAGPGKGELDAATDAYAKLLWEHIYSKIDPTKL